MSSPWPPPAASTDTLKEVLFFVYPSECLLLWGWASSAHVLCEPRIRAALAAACLFHWSQLRFSLGRMEPFELPAAIGEMRLQGQQKLFPSLSSAHFLDLGWGWPQGLICRSQMSHTELKHFHSVSGQGWGSAALWSAETVGGSWGGDGRREGWKGGVIPGTASHNSNSSLAATVHVGSLECRNYPDNEIYVP